MFDGTLLLESYLKNWSILLKVHVCEEHRDTMDECVAEKISNIAIKRYAEDYLARIKPISVAVDRAQADKCSISDVIEVWKKL